jgi:thiamine-phosphate pyrophosphorylase
MLRIVDANLNRIGEGLRLLEDISRFILDDPDISRQLKALRHDLLPTDAALRERLLAARRAGEDVGAFLDVSGEGERHDAAALVGANSRRIQQSLRVLEEITKVPGQDFGLDWEKLKDARFRVYELEQAITLRLSRRDKTERIAGLYLILDTESLKGRDGLEVARLATRAGARVIQLRDKTLPRGELVALAEGLKQVCAQSGALFIVNDYLDVALASGADGLHVGQDDLPVAAARRLLPADKIVGCSAATPGEAVRAQEDGADYVAVGSMYESPSKPGTRMAGMETLREVRGMVSLPLVAIGGINEENAAEVMGAGADAAAVISAVLGAADVEAACRRLTAITGGN